MHNWDRVREIARGLEAVKDGSKLAPGLLWILISMARIVWAILPAHDEERRMEAACRAITEEEVYVRLGKAPLTEEENGMDEVTRYYGMLAKRALNIYEKDESTYRRRPRRWKSLGQSVSSSAPPSSTQTDRSGGADG